MKIWIVYHKIGFQPEVFSSKKKAKRSLCFVPNKDEFVIIPQELDIAYIHRWERYKLQMSSRDNNNKDNNAVLN